MQLFSGIYSNQVEKVLGTLSFAAASYLNRDLLTQAEVIIMMMAPQMLQAVVGLNVGKEMMGVFNVVVASMPYEKIEMVKLNGCRCRVL